MASSGSLSKSPGVQKIVDDIKDCVDQLKTEYNDYQRPLTDDSKVLQRFCVKLEFLLHHGQIERSSFLGGRKDYWNFFIEGLSSVKGVSDGIKFVKSHNELKTNTGRGRGFLRFCLMYQRLADCIQLCVSNTKLINQCYRPSSVWRNPSQSGYLVSILYDLNDVVFDLGAQGYDLDNGWPTFSRADLAYGGQKWNISFSRSSSISSLNHSAMMNSSHMSSSFVEPEILETDEADEDRYNSSLSRDAETESILDGDQTDGAKNSEMVTELTATIAELRSEKEGFVTQVSELNSMISTLERGDSTNQSTITTLKQRVEELDGTNRQMVNNLHQLAKDSNVSAVSQMEHMSKYEELLGRFTELELVKRSKERECDQLVEAMSGLTEQCTEKEQKISHLCVDKTNLEDHLSTVTNSLIEKSAIVEKMSQTLDGQVKCHQEENDSNTAKFSSLQDDYKELSASHAALQSQFHSVTIDLKALQTSHEQLELSQSGTTDYTEGLKGQLTVTQSNYKSSQEQMHKLQTELSQFHKQCKELSDRVNEQTVMNDRLTQQQTDLQKQFDHLQIEHQTVQHQSKQWQDRYSGIKQDKSTLEAKLLEMEKSLDSLLSVQAATKEENSSLNDELSQTQSLLTSLRAEHGALQKSFVEEQSKNATVQSNLVELRNSHQQLQFESESNSKEQVTLRENLEQITMEKERLLTKQADLQSTHKEKESGYELMQQQLASLNIKLQSAESEAATAQSSLVSTEKEYDSLKRQHEDSEHRTSEMEQQLVHIHTAHDKLQSTHRDLEVNCEEVTGNLQDLQGRHPQLESDYERALVELNQAKERNLSLQTSLTADLSQQQQTALQVSLERDQLSSRNVELEGQLAAMRKDLAAIAEEKEILSGRYEEELIITTKPSESLAEVNVEIDELKSSLKSLKSQEVNKRKDLSELQSCLESTKLEFGNKQIIMEQQIGALRFQISSQQMEADLAMEGYKQQQEDVRKMSQTISNQERVIAAIELQVDTLQADKSVETEGHQQQVDELISLLDDKEVELVAICEEMETYKTRCSELTESSESLRETVVQLKLGNGERLARAENELHQFREDNEILKKRLIKLIKDKDSLWQATDALMFRQRKLNEVKWLDSSNIYNCMSCRSSFSLLLRKHHCRLCGQVFCWQCSDNWVDTASSGKKSRACNQCFIEHTNDGLPDALNSFNITNDNSVDSITLPVDVSGNNWGRSNNNGHRISPQSEVSTGSGRTSHSEHLEVTDSSSPINNTKDSPTGLPDVPPNVPPDVPPNVPDDTSNQNGDVVSSSQNIPESKGARSRTIEQIVAEEFEDVSIDDLARFSPQVVETIPYTPSTASLVESLKAEYDTVLSSETFQSEDYMEITINKMATHTVCVVVDKEETTLAWKFRSQPKAAYFQLSYKPYETSFSQLCEDLIPECKCRSHRQEVQGEMISHNSGLYIFSFINKLDRKMSMQYHISVK